jgi:hypothetical protein
MLYIIFSDISWLVITIYSKFYRLLETAFSVLIRMVLSGPGVWAVGGDIGYKTIIFNYLKG